MLPDRPVAPRRTDATRLARRRFITSCVIGFAFTFVVAVGALGLGVLPEGMFGADFGVVLLFVPLFALVMAVTLEVTRVGTGEDRLHSAATPPFTGWKPGHGEG